MIVKWNRLPMGRHRDIVRQRMIHHLQWVAGVITRNRITESRVRNALVVDVYERNCEGHTCIILSVHYNKDHRTGKHDYIIRTRFATIYTDRLSDVRRLRDREEAIKYAEQVHQEVQIA